MFFIPPSAAGGLSPDHLRCFFDDDFAEWISKKVVNDGDGASMRDASAPGASPGRDGSKGMAGINNNDRSSDNDDDQAWLTRRLAEAEAHASTWERFGHSAVKAAGGAETRAHPTKKMKKENGEVKVAEEEKRSIAAPLPPGDSSKTWVVAASPPRLVLGASEVRRRFLQCSVLVGMHPDAATEPIVDFALRHHIPFAVVPCCVHARASPNRRLETAERASSITGEGSAESLHMGAGGRLVRTYDDFVSYLAAKDPRIQRAELPMDGRSTVLYVTKY